MRADTGMVPQIVLYGICIALIDEAMELME